MNTSKSQRAPGCDCSDHQLEQVGCQCVLVTLQVWPRGYASDEGLRFLVVTETANANREAARAFGLSASVHRIVPRHAPAAPVSNAAALAYTRNDNS